MARSPPVSLISLSRLLYRFASHVNRHVTPRRPLCALSSQRLLLIDSQRERLELAVRYGVEFIGPAVVVRHTQP